MKTMKFALDENRWFELEFYDAWDYLNCCSEQTVYFIDAEDCYTVAKRDHIWGFMRAMTMLLTRAFDNELLLPSEMQNVGRFHNERVQHYGEILKNMDDAQRKQEFKEGPPESAYSLISGSLNIWIYNDADGNIMLEVTLVYPRNLTPGAFATYMTYEQFIAQYKPLYKGFLSTDTAHTWLSEAKKMIYYINKNTERIKREWEQKQQNS